MDVMSEMSKVEQEVVESKLSSDVQEQFKDSTMSRAGRLALELNAERNVSKKRWMYYKLKLMT